MSTGKYNEDDVRRTLSRHGVKFGNEQVGNKTVRTADASSLNTVGISLLGKLDYLMNYGNYTVYLPTVGRGRGLAHP